MTIPLTDVREISSLHTALWPRITEAVEKHVVQGLGSRLLSINWKDARCPVDADLRAMGTLI